MDHVEDLSLVCLMLLDALPKLKIIGAEYMDLKLLEGTQYQHLLDEDYIPRLASGVVENVQEKDVEFVPREKSRIRRYVVR